MPYSLSSCDNAIIKFLILGIINVYTMQEHQTIPTNATVSKNSDTISISVIMAVYEIFFFIFQANLRNQ